ncbi:low density lipoprotein receptor adapter protein 1 isoform X5 [Rissa tridactyla]|uniref:low density lipoprotein receptor adapter protein 1 isoform X5 n=1 Tax=Rissa tridactyla TaxID=75485 RepID=UPI0023BAD0DC|nr:low density lipoprotein receptor adapter protein 1 isoform X5 [Rissa tridactyla]
MDALKSAGRALLRSPSVHKPSWAGGRHKKLPENWTDTRETLLEGMLFSLKYMGMTLVEQPKGEELSAAAVKRIVATAKASGKKLQKVTLKVSPRGIVLNDSGTNELIENVSIYSVRLGVRKDVTSLEVSCVCRLQPSAPWPRVALPPVLGNRNAKASGAVTRVEYGGWSEQLRAGYPTARQTRSTIKCLPTLPRTSSMRTWSAMPSSVPNGKWRKQSPSPWPRPSKSRLSSGKQLRKRRRSGNGPCWKEKGQAAPARKPLPTPTHAGTSRFFV